MTTTLCLHASGETPAVFVIRDGEVFLPTLSATTDPTSGPTLEDMARSALEAAGATPADLTGVAVDIGPGRLSAVRASVAFANALAFGLDAPVLPIVSSQAIGMAAEAATGKPALVVHKSAGGTAYAALVEGGALKTLRHGPMAEALAEAGQGLAAAALVGAPADVLPGVDVMPAGEAVIMPETFKALIAAGGFVAAPVHPITEQSELVNG